MKPNPFSAENNRLGYGRMLILPRRENINGNFNGTFTFNSLSDYQKTEQRLQNGMTIS